MVSGTGGFLGWQYPVLLLISIVQLNAHNVDFIMCQCSLYFQAGFWALLLLTFNL